MACPPSILHHRLGQEADHPAEISASLVWKSLGHGDLVGSRARVDSPHRRVPLLSLPHPFRLPGPPSLPPAIPRAARPSRFPFPPRAAAANRYSHCPPDVHTRHFALCARRHRAAPPRGLPHRLRSRLIPTHGASCASGMHSNIRLRARSAPAAAHSARASQHASPGVCNAPADRARSQRAHPTGLRLDGQHYRSRPPPPAARSRHRAASAPSPRSCDRRRRVPSGVGRRARASKRAQSVARSRIAALAGSCCVAAC